MKYDQDAIRKEFNKGLTRSEVGINLGIPYSSIVRYVSYLGIVPKTHEQSEKTRKIRSESLKKAHQIDPTLTIRKTTGFKKFNQTHKGQTIEEKFGKEVSDRIRKASSISHSGKKHSKETKAKIKEGNTGKKMTLESRRKLSATRKAGFKNGSIILGARAGFGKGGYRNDIGHYVRSTYEHYFAQQLIKKNIEYFYEPKSFAIQVNGQETTFTPDFYLITENRWVEIKNPYNAKNAAFLDKLVAFKEQYPNENIEVVVGSKDWIHSL